MVAVEDSKQRGYVALMAVLVVATAALAISFTLLLNATDAQRTSLVQAQAVDARNLANYCAEEAMQQIHDNIAFSGNSTLSVGSDSCTYTVSVTTGTTRSISTSGTVGNIVKKLTISVTIGSSSISATSWQETP